MINLPVDEAYALDYLSILKIKSEVDSEDIAKQQAHDACLQALSAQLGPLMAAILASLEYAELVEANRLTFKAVDLARNGGEITAKEVDDCNMERFRCKVALQQRFFSGTLVESKL